MKLIPVLALLSLAPLSACAMSKKSPAPVAATQPPAPAVDADKIWVGKSDGAKSCEKGSGLPIDKMGADLAASGITPFEKKKIPDGKMRIQMCGADKGDMNGFLIARKDLEKAKELGYKPVTGSH